MDMLKAALTAALTISGAAGAHAALAVSKAANNNVTCTGGACRATAANAVLNVTTLRQMLRTGDVTVLSGADAMDIHFDAPLNWTKPHRLTLDAFRSILFTKPVTSQGTGGVTLVTNDGGSGGDYAFAGRGKIAFWDISSSLIINRAAYTLVDSIAAMEKALRAEPSGQFALAKFYDASVDKIFSKTPLAVVFNGSFTGLGHAIDKLSIHSGKPAAFFKELGAGATVRDFSLTNVDIQIAGGNEAAMLALRNRGRIANLSVSGNLSSHGNQSLVGGVAAFNSGLIIRASSAGTVAYGESRPSIGGLVGRNNDTGTISFSSSSAKVTAANASRSGGLVGENDGAIADSHASGDVNGGNADRSGDVYAGGLVGVEIGSISRSYATGAVNAGNGHDVFAGGLVGFGGTLDQTYATGAVKGGLKSHVGGLCGASCNVANSYALGSATADIRYDVGGLMGSKAIFGTTTVSASYAAGAVRASQHTLLGGFIGYADTGMTDDYWDLDSSGVSDPSKGAGSQANLPGITGLTTAQLKAGLPAGFDPAIWGSNPAVNGGRPYLLALPPQ